MNVSNIWGCVFSFTLPGVILGILIAIAAAQGVQRRTHKRQQPRRRGLYIEDLKEGNR